MDYNIIINMFDAKYPYLYTMYLVVFMLLLAINRSSPIDNISVMINVILYIFITTTIFYTHTINEEKNITEGYYKELISYVYESNPTLYNELKSKMKTKIKTPSKPAFLHKYSTIILSVIMILCTLIYYILNKKSLNLNTLSKYSYYMFALGLTEIFIAFKVMSAIPYPDIPNLLDISVRNMQKCQTKNLKRYIHSENISYNNECTNENFNSCVVNDNENNEEYQFSCVNGKINRKTL